MLLTLLACLRSEPAAPQLPHGHWYVDAKGVVGELLMDDQGCRVGLWGPAWDSGSAGLRACTPTGDGWFSFPLRFGAGEGTGVAQIGGELVLPLGARQGEYELRLPLVEGTLPGERQAQAAAASEAAVLASRTAWEAGLFRLQVQDRLVGELDFRSDQEVYVAVYDPFWMTEGSVRAAVAEQGPELVLDFGVMPRLGENGGRLRVNRVFGLAVVPMAPTPSPEERTLALVPGPVEQAEREAALALAIATSETWEKETTLGVAQELAAEASARPGGCGTLVEASEAWQLALAGYRVELSAIEGGCEVLIEPEPVQFGRRVAARVRADAVVESVVRPLSSSTLPAPQSVL